LELGIENWNLGIGAGMLADTKFQDSKKFLFKMTIVPALEPRKCLIYKALPHKNSKIPRFQQKCVRFPFGEFLGMKVLRQVLKKAAPKMTPRNPPSFQKYWNLEY
jgi:hypothetical protein